MTTMNDGSNQKIRWEGILDTLVEFDHQARPVGLYASEEFGAKPQTRSSMQADWEEIFAPTLKASGCSFCIRMTVALREGRFTFTGPDQVDGYLQVVRLSKIKVRRYGSAYRVDPHHNFSERWQQANLPAKLSTLGRRNQRGDFGAAHRLLLLMGFSTETDPFSDDLAALKQDSGWSKKPIRFVKRTWSDPYDRKFNTLAAMWIYEPEY